MKQTWKVFFFFAAKPNFIIWTFLTIFTIFWLVITYQPCFKGHLKFDVLLTTFPVSSKSQEMMNSNSHFQWERLICSKLQWHFGQSARLIQVKLRFEVQAYLIELFPIILLDDWYHSAISLSFWTLLCFQWKTMNVQNESDIGEWYQLRFLANWRHIIKIGN